MDGQEATAEEIARHLAGLEQAATAPGASAQDVVRLAAALQEQNRLTDGLAALQAGLARFADDPQLLHWLCHLSRRLERYDECMLWARQGQTVAPDKPYFAILLAECQILSGLMDDADRTLRLAFERFPRNAALHDTRAQLFDRTGNWAAAVAITKEALSIDPGNQHRLLRLAHRQFLAGLFDEADATLAALDEAGDGLAHRQRTHQRFARRFAEAWKPWPGHEDPASGWQAEHQSLCRKLRHMRPRLLFIGDSLTAGLESAGKTVWDRYFAPLQAAQIGIVGDRTQNVLWRLENGVAEAAAPEVVVLLIGTNNLSHNDDAGVVRGIVAVMDVLRDKLPRSRLLVLGLLPREPKPDAPLRGRIAAINRDLAPVCAERGVAFADIGACLLDAEGRLAGELSADGVHLTEAGYARWAIAVSDLLAERFDVLRPVHQPVRLAIAGNSNSILASSYMHHLSRMNGFEVEQFSIGGCPNAVLLHMLSRADLGLFDWIICETSVMDAALSGAGTYTRAEAEQIARRFVAAVQAAGRPRLIFLIVPIQADSLSDETLWVRRLYTTLAQECGGYVLDLYAVLERLSGRLAQRLNRAWAEATFGEAVAGFGLSRIHCLAMLYHPVVLRDLGQPPMVQQFFTDRLHIGGLAQIFVTRALALLIEDQAAATPEPRPARQGWVQSQDCLAIPPGTEARLQERRSGLLSRNMAVLEAGGEVHYPSPAGYCLGALLINQGATCGVLEISGTGGVFTVDLRRPFGARTYTALVVPLTEDIGDGPFTLRVRSGEGATEAGRRYWDSQPGLLHAAAEVAELVVVRRDLAMENLADLPRPDLAQLALHPWFDDLLRRCQLELQWVAVSSWPENLVVPRELYEAAMLAFGQDIDRPPAFALARMAFVGGDFARTAALLRLSLEQRPQDAAITAQIAAIDALRASLSAER